MSLGQHVFISSAPPDSDLVARLRARLHERGVAVWQAAAQVAGGDIAQREVQQAIASARSVLVVLGPQTANHSHVRREVRQATETAERCLDDGYRVIPLLLPGLEIAALELWFDTPPAPIVIPPGVAGLDDALPAILAALGLSLPEPLSSDDLPPTLPVEELVLILRDPAITYTDGKRILSARAELIFEPAQPTAAKLESRRYRVQAPLGPIEADELRWYLEEYYRWPFGLFAERGQRIEAQLPEWGRMLYDMALAPVAAREALVAWQQAGERGARRFSVHVDQDVPEGTPEAEADSDAVATREAAAAWLSLPWELLSDGRGYLFQGAQPVRVRRRLPNRDRQSLRTTALPIRVLLLSPRPEQTQDGQPIGFIDPRASAKPLVEAVESLGELVELTRLQPPTLAALDQALLAAHRRGKPYDVVHFDGHGAWSKQAGLGGLYFELADDAQRAEGRRADFVDAGKLAGIFRQQRVPLVFLEACQTAQASDDPTASVAARLLQAGTPSVVAMSHSVLVETARRFVQAFYRSLAAGERVGEAMLAGQRALHDDASRGVIPGGGPLRLADWFVPVIYQERHDPQLITRVPSAQLQRLAAARRQTRRGDLPDEPAHRFHGRRRELLRLERLLFTAPRWLTVTGIGGQGKTALATELARWLLQSRRLDRAAFVSLERYQGVEAVLDTLGHQLLPQGKQFSVAQFDDLQKARLPIERALREAERGVILVIDNVESLLPTQESNKKSAEKSANKSDGKTDTSAENIEKTNTNPDREDSALPAILQLVQGLLHAAPGLHVVFTSRSPLPAPFDHPGRHIELSSLAPGDAIDLVREVLTQHGAAPKTDPDGTPAPHVRELVEAVRCHPRALVLVARELASRSLRRTTADLRQILADLDARHPGDRENSLYASVELSLRRLSPPTRAALTPLAVCEGGIQLAVLRRMTDLDTDQIGQLARELITVGLGEDLGDGHLRLDPGLPPYLLRQISAEQADALRTRFAGAMAVYTGFLYQQLFKDAHLAIQLTRHELANLLTMLTWHSQHAPAENVVDLADSVERLVADFGLPQALKRASAVREHAHRQLGAGWSRSKYLSESAAVNRLIAAGDLRAALIAAQRILTQCQAVAASAYPEAAYDLALAFLRLGRVLKMGHQPEVALVHLQEARTRFQALAAHGHSSAEGMASLCLTESGDCLQTLGRYDAAAAAYQEAIRQAAYQGRLRDVTVGQTQLGTTRLMQKRYPEALALYQEAREIFSQLGEPRSVAVAWHQIGMCHEKEGHLDRAESAYRESLAINVREGNLAGQATSLGQLGTLYRTMKRYEEAVPFYEKAAEILVRCDDLGEEGRWQSNLADTLIKLQRYDAARRALQRALECNRPFGHAAEPWKTWAVLSYLETATQQPKAARAARVQAEAAYLHYRQDGGDSQSPNSASFAAVLQALQHGAGAQTVSQLEALRKPEDPPFLRALITVLLAILQGDRRPQLADDPDLQCIDAVELRLLLAALAEGEAR